MNAQTIDICICTFRRPSLHQTLASIATQRLPPGIEVRVIIADNDEHDARRGEISEIAGSLGLDFVYVHAPFRNISIARNACLAAASGDWLAFIDDDEQARSDWLARLVRRRNDYDVVFGVSQALYDDPAIPRWIATGDFHSNRLAGNDAAWNGYTANVLLDRRFVAEHGLWFREALGQTGGEDTAFFLEANDAGARFGYAPDAIVTEDTPASRATFHWLAWRRFRSGQTHYMLFKHRRGAIAASAMLKGAACVASLMLSATRPLAARRAALRAIFHAGVVASRLGLPPHLEYGERRARRGPPEPRLRRPD